MPDDAEVAARREAVWAPYHAQLRAELDRIRAQHGVAVLWDAHSIRSVLEAYAASAGVAGAEEATACGIGLQAAAKGDWNVTVRVTSKGGTQILYKLDRWD